MRRPESPNRPTPRLIWQARTYSMTIVLVCGLTGVLVLIRVFAAGDRAGVRAYSMTAVSSLLILAPNELLRAYYEGVLCATPGSLQLDPVSRAVRTPSVTFTKNERSFPQGAPNYGTSQTAANPQYHWECMFRRNGGKVQVAVFVYRVAAPGGDTRPYAPNALDNGITLGAPAGAFVTSPVTPPLPCLYLAPNFGTTNSWPNRTSPLVSDIIPGTNTAATFSATAIWDDWQAPGQWLVDNHATVHRVLNGRRNASQGPVKLQRPVPVLPEAPVNGVLPTGGPASNAFIGGFWFIPTRDAKGNILTPVYAAVEDL